MSLDIVLFAVIAAVLIHRLRTVLGTRHGDERQRPNPFAGGDNRPGYKTAKEPSGAELAAKPTGDEQQAATKTVMELRGGDLIAGEGEAREEVRDRLVEIASADPTFEVHSFINGGCIAFKMIVNAFARGDEDTLEPLLSPKLMEDFSKSIAKRLEDGHTMEIELHRIKKALVKDARLGGSMAYVTVEFHVEETAVTRDADGEIISGDPERITEVTDVWTFARDIRANDPNWLLIETSTEDR